MELPYPPDQILDGSTPEENAQSLMLSLGFSDPQAAMRHLRRMAAQTSDPRDDGGARQALSALLPQLLGELAACANPDQALVNMERFSGDHAAETFKQLLENPRALEILATIFAGSQFLTEILLRDPQHFQSLIHRRRLVRQKTSEEFHSEAMQAVDGLAPQEQLNSLRRYQRGELLRIGASDLLDLYDLPTVAGQLSNLADGMARACLAYASRQTQTAPAGFVVVALGKLGGEELNYSSDIDLLFLCSDNAVDKLRLGQSLIEALSSTTPEGFLYRVDMRLRPWGRDGALVASLEHYLAYLNRNAALWEKQALLKARPIAGDLSLGKEALKQIGTAIFGASPESVRASVRAMKQRTEEILSAKGRDWGEVKLGAGSIRDVEFVAQFLQLAYGGQNPKLRERSTLKALPRLQQAGLLTARESRVLADGYIFLRTVEHYLQMMHYRQTYTLPNEPNAIRLLARRLGFRGTQASPEQQFLERYSQHSTAIRSIYSKYVGAAQSPDTPEIDLVQAAPVIAIQQHLARMEDSYQATFSEEQIRRHAMLAEALNDEELVMVDTHPGEDAVWQVTIVAYDYLGELSLICGLMFVYGLNILDGQVFTYETAQKPEVEPEPTATRFRRRARDGRLIKLSAAESPQSGAKKIVDVFTVRALDAQTPDWERYGADLRALLKMMQAGQRREARSELAKRVGQVFEGMRSADARLYPINIKIDNETSARHTVLHIETIDTVGFLYEFTNALSMTHTYIARMVVQSGDRRINDVLYVTGEDGGKIASPEKQRELRAAAVLIKHFTHLLPGSPNPATALLHFRAFLAQLFERPNWPDELATLEQPQVLNNLTQLLGTSDFLWDDFMRMQYANLFPVLSDAKALDTAKSRAQLEAELERELNPKGLPNLKATNSSQATNTQTTLSDQETFRVSDGEESVWRKALNEFKDREMFRIDMRHLLGHTAEFWDFSGELTDLAEVVIRAAYELTVADMRRLHGTPRLEDGSPCGMTALALGKCGGRELGFASDIELMFVYAGNGISDGPESISTAVFYEKVAQNFLTAIRARQEGIFQVDLQLRPYGKAGSMAVSLEAFRRYYAPEGPAWAYERQALVKMRPIAGEAALGAELCALRDEFVYNGAPFDVTALRAMRERQVRHLVHAGKFNAKYSPGGLVDVEYLVQGLQITHGAANPDFPAPPTGTGVRSTNIREAMEALNRAGILAEADYTRLRKAHTFLRWIIDGMRVVRGNAKDITVPSHDSEEFAFLARRLRYGNDLARLREDLQRYQSDVQEINARLLK